MGAWGMAPWENDDYADLWIEVRQAFTGKGLTLDLVMNRLSERPGSTYPTELWARVGVALMIAYSGLVDDDQRWSLAEEAERLLGLLKEDHEFLASWRNPKAFRKMFDAIGDQVEDLRESYGKHERPPIQEAFKDLEKDGHKGELPGGRRRARR